MSIAKRKIATDFVADKSSTNAASENKANDVEQPIVGTEGKDKNSSGGKQKLCKLNSNALSCIRAMK